MINKKQEAKDGEARNPWKEERKIWSFMRQIEEMEHKEEAVNARQGRT